MEVRGATDCEEWLGAAYILAAHKRGKAVARHGWVTTWRCGCQTTSTHLVHLEESCTVTMRQLPFPLYVTMARGEKGE